MRGLYYQAEVARLPGIDKTDAGYDKVQRQVLKPAPRRSARLRRHRGRDALDAQAATVDGIEEALSDTARLYRKALWTDAEAYVEVWCEKDALAGVIIRSPSSTTCR